MSHAICWLIYWFDRQSTRFGQKLGISFDYWSHVSKLLALEGERGGGGRLLGRILVREVQLGCPNPDLKLVKTQISDFPTLFKTECWFLVPCLIVPSNASRLMHDFIVSYWCELIRVVFDCQFCKSVVEHAV